MLEKPRVEDEKIIACLNESYGLTVTGLEFLPLGYDSYAGVYRVEAGGGPYFLKLKGDAVDERSVRLPYVLKTLGIGQIVAPLPTLTQELRSKIDPFTVLLYPFIDGKRGMEIGLSDRQWIELGAIVKQLHTTALPPDLVESLPKENFLPQPNWAAVIQRLRVDVLSRVYYDPAAKQLAGFWKDHRDEIDTIVKQVTVSGRILDGLSLDLVLCHADLHTNNVLVDDQGRLFIVDWDQPILAPKECDLQFFTVGDYVTNEREEALFFQGYGKTDVDLLVMAYYRYERVMEDLAAFAERVFFIESSDETRQDSVRKFIAQFRPGSAVDNARRLDHVVSACLRWGWWNQ